MDDAQLNKILARQGERLAKLEEGHVVFKEQLDANNKLTAGIYELSANMKNLTAAVEKQGEQIKDGLEKQGERMGAMEKRLILAEQKAEKVDEHEKRLDEYDKAPAKKADKVKWIIVTAAITATVSAIIAAVVAFLRSVPQ